MVNSQNIAILSEKVAALEAAIKNAGIELPEVSSSDNGKALQVVDGAWATGAKIPATATDITYDNTTVGGFLDNLNSDNVAVKEVLSIPANTYNTYALALAALEAAFDALTLEDKFKARIVRSDSVQFYIQSVIDKTFAFPTFAYNTGTKELAQTIDLTNHTYTTLVNDSGTFTRNDLGSAEQGLKIALLLI